MPHLSGGSIILVKEKYSLTGGCKQMCAQNLTEIIFFSAYGPFLGSFISAHEAWDQHVHVALIRLFSVAMHLYSMSALGL